MTTYYSSIDQCINQMIEKVGPSLVIGTPLGLGKANLLLNGIYQRAIKDSSLNVTLITALTLEVPQPNSELEARFLQPAVSRWFDGYPELDYAKARSNNSLPDNFRVIEFFMSPGKFLYNDYAQQNYISSNYTHVARDMLGRDVNVVMQMVSPGKNDKIGRVSLSCNPDVSLELVPKMRATGRKVMVIGECNEALPYMYGDADVEQDYFDALFMPPQKSYRLFAPPKTSISLVDYMVGLHASALVRDNGTLQIGIGSLGDAVAYGLGKREQENADYRALIGSITSPQGRDLQNKIGSLSVFEKGLYGATEMFVDGFLYLFDHGILKRRVYDDLLIQRLINDYKIEHTVDARTLDAIETHGGFAYPLELSSANYLQSVGVLGEQVVVHAHGIQVGDHTQSYSEDRDTVRDFIVKRALGVNLANPTVMHGGFFLGNQEFYQRLRDLNESDRCLLKMTSVKRINQLYFNEALDRIQRNHARFINTCLMVTLNGTIVSDGLDNLRVVSGVGGQYNFVAMAHALENSRSIIKLRSTYTRDSKVHSNIVLNYAHATIPRHLRDVVVTEYGVADLRGKTDEECAAALINIADSRFQNELVAGAKASGKLPKNYKIPDEYQENTRARIEQILAPYRLQGWFEKFPLGCDFTDDEVVLGAALKRLEAKGKTLFGKLRLLVQVIISGSPNGKEALLARMTLAKPSSLKERFLQRLVASEL